MAEAVAVTVAEHQAAVEQQIKVTPAEMVAEGLAAQTTAAAVVVVPVNLERLLPLVMMVFLVKVEMALHLQSQVLA